MDDSATGVDSQIAAARLAKDIGILLSGASFKLTVTTC